MGISKSGPVRPSIAWLMGVAVLSGALLMGQPGVAQSQAAKAKMVTALNEAAKQIKAGEVAAAIEILDAADPAGKDARANKFRAIAFQNRGSDRYRAGKLDLAYRDYYSANRFRPGHETTLQGLGIITFSLNRKRDAAGYMKKVLAINPKNPHALSILGRIAAKQDDVQAASKYFQRAAEQSPEREDYANLANKLGKEAEVEKNFVTLDKGNFRVQFEKGRTVGVEGAIRSVHAYLEQAHRELAGALGGRPHGRVTVVIYNQSQYRRVSSVHTWARAYFDGKLRVALKSWPAGREALRRDLRHELTHAFIHSLYAKAPSWLHEGLAQIIEGKKPSGAAAQFRSGALKLLPKKLFLGEFIKTKSPQAAHIGYAEALMLVGHLKKLGNSRRLQSLLREFERGSGTDKALRTVYRKSLDELLAAAMR